MYTEKDLKKKEYFNNIDNSYLLDPLTKTIRREHIINYVNYLIDNNSPFYLCIIDIDNFKLVNDSFGHQMGDKVLEQAAADIKSVFEKAGCVGRYGGDEFLIVVTEETYLDYNSLWLLLKYYFENTIRDRVYKELSDTRITVTVGAVKFPVDSKDYDGLFLKADKALYRGKQKGRNCFIIYQEEKHGNIDATFLHNEILFTGLMQQIYDIMLNKNKLLNDRINMASSAITSYLSISGVAFQEESKEYISKGLNKYLPYNIILELKNEIDSNDMLVCNDYSNYLGKNKIVHTYCHENKVKSFIIVKIYGVKKTYGYLTFLDNSRKRIWQSENRVLFKYYANILGLILDSED